MCASASCASMVVLGERGFLNTIMGEATVNPQLLFKQSKRFFFYPPWQHTMIGGKQRCWLCVVLLPTFGFMEPQSAVTTEAKLWRFVQNCNMAPLWNSCLGLSSFVYFLVTYLFCFLFVLFLSLLFQMHFFLIKTSSFCTKTPLKVHTVSLDC